ncbi:MAG: VanZ family protein [Clostridia bacterium]|nr:VanZ family protein [Clostridia bacterium]
MKRIRFKRIALWLLVIAITGVIFFFSSMEGPESMDFSNGSTIWFIRLFHPDYEQMPPEEQEEIYQLFVFIVRKTAHFTEFAALGFSLWQLLHDYQVRRAGLWSWVIGTLYACLDEIHQGFVGTRTASLTDVGIDSAGVLFGTLFIYCVFRFVEQRKKKRTAS